MDYGAGALGQLLDSYLFIALAANQNGLFADVDGRDVCDVNHGGVHRDAANYRDAAAPDQDFSVVGEHAGVAVTVAQREEGDSARPGGFPGAAITDTVARLQVFHQGYARAQGEGTANGRDFVSWHARVEAVNASARADEVMMHVRVKDSGGSVAAVFDRDRAKDGLGDLDAAEEVFVLPAGEIGVGFGHGEVGKDAGDAKGRELSNRAEEVFKGVEADALTSHARIDLDVDHGGCPAAGGSVGKSTGLLDRGDGWDCAGVEDGVGFVRRGFAEDEDGGVDAGVAKLSSFLGHGNAEPFGAGIKGGLGDGDCAVAVSVALHNSTNSRRRAAKVAEDACVVANSR